MNFLNDNKTICFLNEYYKQKFDNFIEDEDFSSSESDSEEENYNRKHKRIKMKRILTTICLVFTLFMAGRAQTGFVVSDTYPDYVFLEWFQCFQ